MSKEKKIVLIVDDSPLVIERLVPMLEEVENIQFVMHAGTYREAVELISQISPHMVLLDIGLPDKSGIELLKTIREMNKEIIVLMNTNHASDYHRTICRKMGARYFFDKSTDFSIIPEVIASSK